jgi:type VI secretion system protein ImpM
MSSRIGFFGKLPGHGDFIERNFPPALRHIWDEWLQRGLAESQRALGGTWLDTYLTSPIWRFFLSEGVAGVSSYAGVLVPSVDRVGRYFPLTVAVELSTDALPLKFASTASPWFDGVERACMEALRHPEMSIDDFLADLAGTGDLLARADVHDNAAAPLASANQWRFALSSAQNVAEGLAGPMSIAAQNALRPLTMWWSDGSDRISPSALLVQSLPRPRAFAALLAGGWADGQWAGDIADIAADTLVSDLRTLAPPPMEIEIASASVTDTGPRTVNQDRHAQSEATRIWAVADGMGGHARGEVASQMIVDSLNDLAPTSTLNTAFEGMATALQRVNDDLHRKALSTNPDDTDQRCGSTVVALAIRSPYWGVIWAGDSRAYLLRDGMLSRLTTDHTSANELANAAGVSLTDLVTSNSGEITRAVGGAAELELDRVSDLVAPGDRFLLCSDGLYGVLDDTAIAGHLLQQPAESAARALVKAALSSGTRDNVTAVVVDVIAPSPGLLS